MCGGVCVCSVCVGIDGDAAPAQASLHLCHGYTLPGRTATQKQHTMSRDVWHP